MIVGKALIVGAKGLVGAAISKYLRDAGWKTMEMDIDQLDVTNRIQCQQVVKQISPDLVVNASAYLNADRCQRNPEKSYAVNVLGVRNLVETIRTGYPNALFVHFSSDFVFSGEEGGYREEDLPAPISTYGMHKWLADEIVSASGVQHYIFRIASVIGVHPSGNNFLQVIVRKAIESQDLIRIVSDLRISFTTADFIAQKLVEILEIRPSEGLYHCVANGVCSWFEIAREGLNILGIDREIVPISASEYPFGAPRPMDSSLKNEKITSILGTQPHWREVLGDHLDSYRQYYLGK